MKNHETNRVERLEQLILSKAFHELTDDEKEFVLEEFQSEEHYQAMRKLTPILDEMIVGNEHLEPKQSILESLKDGFAMKTSTDSIWNTWLAWKVPAYATFLLTGFCCLMTWWIVAEPPIELVKKPLLVKIDTIYVASKPDTVYKEKIVYRLVTTVAKIKPADEPSNNLMEQKNSVPVGVSMKDKEELEKLLVSGSR